VTGFSESKAPRPPVVRRVLAILEAFSPEQPELSLAEIGRCAGLPPATAHRLVGELAAWGALERTSGGRYRIGLRLWEVGALAPRGLGLRELALPFLEDLYEATHQNVQLAVLDGLDVVYLERLWGKGAVHVLTRVGLRFPAHATGVGLVLLAYAAPEVQEAAIAGTLRRFTDRTITDGGRLRRVLAEVRRCGVAVSDGQVEVFALSVAAPVYGRDDEVVAAVSVVVDKASGDARSVEPAVRATARGISRSLGAPRALRPTSAVRNLPSDGIPPSPAAR
jgi:DNA-binding IclR family transcriptional regulator